MSSVPHPFTGARDGLWNAKRGVLVYMWMPVIDEPCRAKSASQVVSNYGMTRRIGVGLTESVMQRFVLVGPKNL